MAIVQHDIFKALNDWGESLIAISRAYEENGLASARAIAEQTLDRLYGFELGPVLFKPTLSGGPQTFRLTKIGALSYFCLLYTSPSPRDYAASRMPSSA